MATEVEPSAKPADEIEKRREYRFKLFDRALASVSALGIICSGIFGLASFANQGRLDRAVRERELQLTIYREKKEVYYPLCDSAAAIVSSASQAEAKPRIKEFMTLYYGKAHLITIDEKVNQSKVDFQEQLTRWAGEKEQTPPPKELIRAALRLTGRCRDYLDPRTVLGHE